MTKELHKPASPHQGPTDGPLPVAQIVSRLSFDRVWARAPNAPRSRSGRITIGRLEAHGRANYQFKATGSPSYYVTILSVRRLETLWGVDLERAIRQSKTQPQVGSVVGVKRVGSEPVTLPASSVARQRTVRRAKWIVESVTFFGKSIEHARREREAQLADQKALQERPELRSAFVSLPVAEKFAERNIADSNDRELFIERVKAVMALSARQGAPIPAPRPVNAEDRLRTPRRDEPTR